MKPNKALRRLTRIEELMSDVMERFSTNAPFIRKALQDAVAAVAVAKEAVSLVSSSGTTNDSPVTDSVPPAAISRIPKATRKVSAGRTPVKKRTAKKKAAAPKAATQTPD